MARTNIVVTGANGQVGRTIRTLAGKYPEFDFLFLSREDLPIDQVELVRNYFERIKPAYCINCAAYTAVDKAETERDLAMLINGEAVGVLAAACRLFNTRMIHISTDYVFDGTATHPYKEDDSTVPVNYYGATKLRGEKLGSLNNPDSIIIRTSWVYSEFGNNFVKTMVRLMQEKNSLRIVNDQLGSPTYAADLSKAILDIIRLNESSPGSWKPGIYHYSNEGVISWYDFAVAIKQSIHSSCDLVPIPSSEYPTPARRPAYSALNKDKIKTAFDAVIPGWKDSLHHYMMQGG